MYIDLNKPLSFPADKAPQRTPSQTMEDILNDFLTNLDDEASFKEMEIIAGDTVMLNSGGPAMTVLEVCDEGEIIFCGWFDGAVYREAEFPPESIYLVMPA